MIGTCDACGKQGEVAEVFNYITITYRCISEGPLMPSMVIR